MISRAAHAGQILTIWTILGIVVWAVLLLVEGGYRLLARSWADGHEWTDAKNPAAGYEPVDGAETHEPRKLARYPRK